MDWAAENLGAKRPLKSNAIRGRRQGGSGGGDRQWHDFKLSGLGD